MPAHLIRAAALVAIVFGIWLPSSGFCGEWSAGVASEKITPQKPIPLAGYAFRTMPFQSVDQDIYVKALAIKDQDGNGAVLVTIDLCILPQEVGARIREQIAEKTHLGPEAILLNVAHSHSAPNVSFHSDPASTQPAEVQQATVDYTNWLVDHTVSTAEQAFSHLQPVALSWGSGVANFAMNRRQYTDRGVVLGANPRGPVDRTVPVLRIDGSDGKPLAVLFGYACHNTTLPPRSLAVSGDYQGYAKQYIQEHQPGVQALFIPGCCGDADPYPRTGLQFAKDHGEELGKEVCRVLETKLQPIHGPLKCAMVTAQLPLQTPDRPTLESIQKAGPALSKQPAREMLETIQSGHALPATYPAPVSAWQFGKDLTLIALPDEVVVEYVHRLEKAVGPLRLWTAAYCQEVAGYIPSEAILKEGGYETRGLYFGTGWFAPGVEDALVKAAREAAIKAGRTMPVGQ